MLETRRNFLTGFCSASVSLGLAARAIAQQPQQRKNPTTNVEPKVQDDDAVPLKPSATKALLEENNKDIKKNVEKLYQLASDLKAEVEKTDSVQVLSLAMVKKAEEIEKLAKNIKTRAKG
jgi:hypothetical protein